MPDLAGAQALAGAAAPRGARAPAASRESVPLWLLDEPFAALDTRRRRAHRRPARAAPARAAAAVVYTTHQPTRRSTRGARDRARLDARRRPHADRARDLLLACAGASDVATALLFFVIVASLFPLGIGAEPNLLRAIAPGVIWVAALLSSMLSLGAPVRRRPCRRHARADAARRRAARRGGRGQDRGALAGLRPAAGADRAGASRCNTTSSARSTACLRLSFLLGTPVLSFIGAIGAALTLGLRGGGVLLSLLVLPLYVPVLILGAGAVEWLRRGSPPRAAARCLARCSSSRRVFAPWATAVALRVSVE